MNPLKELLAQGQSVWLDYIRRDLIRTGELKRLDEEDGIRGVTSNPTLFEKPIAGHQQYTHFREGHPRQHGLRRRTAGVAGKGPKDGSGGTLRTTCHRRHSDGR